MFATGVAIVTARGEDGAPLGMTINSFNSVSLEPPLVLWSLAQRSSLLQALASSRHCAIHVLTARQRSLAERFATRGIDRWAGVDHPAARGLSYGINAHAIGTAHALQEGEEQGAMGGLAMILAGILTAALAPVAVWVVLRLPMLP